MDNKIIFNVPAKDFENAREIYRIAGDHVLIGILVKEYPSTEAAATVVRQLKEAGIPVSVGLGGGDPAQWKRVLDVALATGPSHVNQVFPAASYTLGRLEQSGLDALVNALIEPSKEPGKVYIATGPRSSRFREPVSCEQAAAMTAEVGVVSVKFHPMEGLNELDGMAAMARAATRNGITTFEPAGGLNLENVHKIVSACLECGVERVIPHLYTSVTDPVTHKTEAKYIEALMKMCW